MPATRTSARLADVALTRSILPTTKVSSKAWRSAVRKPKPKPKSVDAAPSQLSSTSNVAPISSALSAVSGSASIPATLTFSFEDAKNHLIGVDARFDELFGRLKCKPFEELEVVNPFRFVCLGIILCQTLNIFSQIECSCLQSCKSSILSAP